MKTKKRKTIHKGEKSFIGVYNYCDDTMRGEFAEEWKKVTCKKCLKKGRNNGVI